MKFELYSAADNRFLLVRGSPRTLDWSALARRVCAEQAFEGRRCDGLLLVEARGDGRTAMVIYNADGSRPEACGNGLRCVGWHLTRESGGEVQKIETDAGLRRVEISRIGTEIALLLAEMGRAERFPLASPLCPEAEGLAATGVRIGNPHCVIRVEDERGVAVDQIGRAMQSHPDFPRGVNVGFLCQREDRWNLRVWERGVGETAACGTGACAAAAWVGDRGSETTIEMRGGRLVVRRDQEDRYFLFGEAVHHGSVDLEVAVHDSASMPGG